MFRAFLCALFVSCGLSPLAFAVPAASASSPASGWQRALHANNLGVAYMGRNEFAPARAQFRAALAAAPGFTEARVNLGIAQYAAGHNSKAQATLRTVLRHDAGNLHAHYTLGLIAKNTGDYTTALREFRQVLVRAPGDKDANYYAGFCSFHLRQYNQAIIYYDRAVRANPYNVSAVFGLANAYRAKGDSARAMLYLRRFQALRQLPLNTSEGTVYGSEGDFGKVIALVPRNLQVKPHPVAVKFVDDSKAVGLTFKDGASDPDDSAGPGACVIDAFGDGRPGLFLVNSNGRPALYRNLGGGHLQDVTAGSGLERTEHGIACSVGDYDNDGKADLLVTEPHHILLFHNEGNGKFKEVGAASGVKSAGENRAAAFVDLDHDGFLDIVVSDSGAKGTAQVFRNLGTGKFAAEAVKSRIGQKPGSYSGILATDFDNDHAVDIVLTRRDGPASLYRNLRNGRFEPLAPWPAAATQDARGVIALDYNKDGWMDLFLTRRHGPPVLLRNTGTGRFVPVPLPAINSKVESAWGATAIDFDNDGFVDVAFVGRVDGKDRIFLYRNLGDGGFADASAETGLANVVVKNPRTLLAVDLSGQGAPDLLVTQAGGSPIYLRNQGATANHSFRLIVHGLKDNSLGIGNKESIRAGGLWQKLEVEGGSGYLGENSTSALFGLGQQEIDTVRILWPTGVDQDEIPGHVAEKTYRELDRKGGSCPILYSWDGRRFAFVDDIVGPGVVGEWVSPSEYDQPQTSECLKIPASAVRERHGGYDFRFNDQMAEVVYLDQVHLMAVDHPAGTDVFTNDKYQPDGTAPRFHLWPVKKLRLPVSAVDESGRNALPDLRRGRTIPIKAHSALREVVGEHSLTLGLGTLRGVHSAQLLLHGWTDYYFPNTVWTAYHAGINMNVPDLEIPNGRGGWRVVKASLGMPAGLPRWIVVDLTPYLHLFPKGDHRIRIRTNLAIYWDRAELSLNAPEVGLKVTRLQPERATLRHYGFPAEVRRSPESYVYNELTDVHFATPAGDYTRYGDIRPLLKSVDDEYAIMAPGDEVALHFDARRLPVLRPGWVRTFFFCADGFTKGTEFLDYNRNSIRPLPLHGVNYPAHEWTPFNEPLWHLKYRLKYNTRHIGGEPTVTPAATGGMGASR